ncbi:MAG: hypothetical protein Q8M92_05765, partial [Candidatus Subteraquimicrobiales bacterium]|nr:hypothetical protein [Candidatus Subteraquimicrobiales bacterium]
MIRIWGGETYNFIDAPPIVPLPFSLLFPGRRYMSYATWETTSPTSATDQPNKPIYKENEHGNYH